MESFSYSHSDGPVTVHSLCVLSGAVWETDVQSRGFSGDQRVGRSSCQKITYVAEAHGKTCFFFFLSLFLQCLSLCSSSRPWTVFVAQTGLLIFQPQPLNCCDYRYALQYPAQKFLLNGFAQWDIVRNKCWCQDPSLNKVVSNRIQGWEALDTGKKDKVDPHTLSPLIEVLLLLASEICFPGILDVCGLVSRCIHVTETA